ncbi:hypothetical protein [Nonomuraea fuscirosea]|uniref:hypothetical protein n=1 Tax=Nonomuraea fuscirosea TaxID=1291556 RepID=UPI00342F0354
MKLTLPLACAQAILVLAAGCSTTGASPPDTRPLGNVTSSPRECDLISAEAIRIATGLTDYKAFGTKTDMGRHFESCTVSKKSGAEDGEGLLIEVFDPSPISPEGLENTKKIAQGNDLPGALGPGFAARRENAQDQRIAFVYGWTSDYKRLLTINLVEGAPGRDSLADATEFFRQLKPLLLA